MNINLNKEDYKTILESIYIRASGLTGSCFMMDPTDCRKSIIEYLKIYKKINGQTGINAFDMPFDSVIKSYEKFGIYPSDL